MIDSQPPGALKLLSDTISKDIDLHCVDKWNDGPRGHLGASVIGHPCPRHLWYGFRWISHKIHNGRQYRLFNRGHFEEPRFKSYLEGIGCKVTEFDESNLQETDKGKRQIRISSCKGHFGGSVDAIVLLPERYGLTEPILGEYKTQGTGPKFTKLKEMGVKLEKHQHFAQMSIYGYKLGLKHAVYIVVNKNDDSLHIEVIELDWELGKFLENKAEEIIFSQEPPTKISVSSSFFECKWCDNSEVCWSNKPADKNCRSCFMAKPVDNAEWNCSYYCGQIPKEFIKVGCDNWRSLI